MREARKRPDSESDGLGDWRIQAASRLVQAVPPAFVGGPSHAAGAPVHLTTATEDARKRPIGFVTPSSAALALHMAYRSSERARHQHATLKFIEVLTPRGKGYSVAFGDVEPLYDYFEECIGAVIFSFQALEAFSNYEIAQNLKGKFELKRGKDTKSVTPRELERIASTEEKLASVLPTILSLPSPKGRTVWGAFANLKRTRDASVHLKSNDQYPNRIPGGEEHDSLFRQFLISDDIAYFVRAAINMMCYFYPTERRTPRWLRAAQELCPEPS